ncbi:hypothetical protein CH367_11800 [Leptospira barantonii]|uniref:Uncharacterized protein n=1 Tax=Leptospira barantonii TaxID=2023184 RepID=A0ABX4NM58_9LEPT|nr:hypothetical protein CH367_11800 [Leptospira barantonii]
MVEGVKFGIKERRVPEIREFSDINWFVVVGRSSDQRSSRGSANQFVVPPFVGTTTLSSL